MMPKQENKLDELGFPVHPWEEDVAFQTHLNFEILHDGEAGARGYRKARALDLNGPSSRRQLDENGFSRQTKNAMNSILARRRIAFEFARNRGLSTPPYFVVLGHPAERDFHRCLNGVMGTWNNHVKKNRIGERQGWLCNETGVPITLKTSRMDHIKSYRNKDCYTEPYPGFRRMIVDGRNFEDDSNVQLLSLEADRIKTGRERGENKGWRFRGRAELLKAYRNSSFRGCK